MDSRLQTRDSKEPVRVALVGLGGHGRTIQEAAAAVEGLEVAAVYDPAAEEAEAAARRFGCAAASSYEALLARGDLEAVALVTPNHLHRPQAEDALAAGLHVHVEKPIANTVADGRAMAAAAERAGRVLMVGHNMRRSRAVREAHRLLDEGRVGEVVSVEVHFSADSTRRMPADAWRLRPEQCPLLPVMQLGIHGIDLVHDLFGPIREVYAFAGSVTTRPEVVDSVAAVFRTAGGVRGTLVSNYCTPIAFEVRIAGTEAALHLTPHRVWFRRAADTDEHGDGPAETWDFTQYDREVFRLQLEAFAEAVRGRAAPDTDAATGLQALAVVEALERAAAAEVPQRVPSFERQPGPVENTPGVE